MWVQDYEKFAFVLRNALKNNNITLSKKIKYEYEPLWAIHAVVRAESDSNQLSEEDFYSQEERKYYGNKIPRGIPYKFSDEPGDYSCSFFKTKEALCNALHLPRKGWKLAIGNIVDSYGGIQHKNSKPHIHLYRYDKVIPEFEIVDYNKLDDRSDN